MQARKGFTLIELLIVIGVIAILAGIVLVAVDPAKRLKDSRDARRAAESNALLNAILNYTADSKGTLPASLSATTVPQVVGSATSGCDVASLCPPAGSTAAACANLNGELVDTYIAQLPIDPKGTNGTDAYDATKTGYYVQRTSNGRVTVGSCNPEDVASISVKR